MLHCPSKLYPHAVTVPSDRSARVWSRAAETAVMFVRLAGAPGSPPPQLTIEPGLPGVPRQASALSPKTEMTWMLRTSRPPERVLGDAFISTDQFRIVCPGFTRRNAPVIRHHKTCGNGV